MQRRNLLKVPVIGAFTLDQVEYILVYLIQAKNYESLELKYKK